MNWWDKKPASADRPAPVVIPFKERIGEKSMVETLKTSVSNRTETGRTVFGPSLVLKGELSGNEDLVIFGQVEGRISVPSHSVTVGTEGKVKAEIRASRVIIEGSVEGNINVPDRVEIRRTGHVIGDLTAPGISIENGAFLRGMVEIIREGESRGAPGVVSLPSPEGVA
jgi:cytoskeletal protein CcmA (bactofilin family)